MLAAIWLVHFACTWQHIFHGNFAIIRKALAVNIASKIFVISEYLVENECSLLNVSIILLFCLWFSIKIWEIIEIEREKRHEIDRQRRPRNSRCSGRPRALPGVPGRSGQYLVGPAYDQNPGHFKMKIDDVSVKFG